jgi:hypothetical protein
MDMRATNLSCYADDKYKAALNALAARRGIKVAQLVRNALDAFLGDEINAIQGQIFLPQDVHKWTNKTAEEQKEAVNAR